MGGYSFGEDCRIMMPRTLVLVGKTGNGKSATGNSILGMQMFPSKRSSSAVTKTSELRTSTMVDGQTLNVIDTPGLFDSSVDFEFTKKEIFNCINMARDGFDAFLVVISVCNRFAEDEQAAISSMLTLFRRKFCDYMIIVFTGGDELEGDHESLQDYLHNSSEALQETLGMCGNRCVLFNNKTKDPIKRSDQVQKLLSLVNMVSEDNGGKPYTNGLFTELKKCTWELDEQQISVYDEQLKRIYEMVESKVKEMTLRLQQLLAKEQTAQLKAVENATTSQNKSDKEMPKKWTRELDEHEILACDEQFKRIFEMACYFIGREVDSKLKETFLKLEKLLGEERTARLKAEENAKIAQKKSEMEMQKIELNLKETTLKLEQLLTEDRIAHLEAEENAKIAQKNSDAKIQKIESNLKETTLKLHQLWAEELTNRLKAEENAKAAQKKSYDVILKSESKLKEISLKLQELLVDEQRGCMKVEENVKAAQNESGEEIHKVELKLKEKTWKDEQPSSDKEIQKELDDSNEQGYKEQSEVGYFVGHLVALILAYKQAANADPKYEHICMSERFKVLQVCLEAENWLKDKMQVQSSLPKHAHPVLLSSDIKKKAEEVERVCRVIMPKPELAPPMQPL